MEEFSRWNFPRWNFLRRNLPVTQNIPRSSGVNDNEELDMEKESPDVENGKIPSDEMNNKPPTPGG